MQHVLNNWSVATSLLRLVHDIEKLKLRRRSKTKTETDEHMKLKKYREHVKSVQRVGVKAVHAAKDLWNTWV